ncbi:resistance protein [Musa troglodytarum]|uniref:Resistance protein n=2 Tax=Musa troglodytarum TaxID=320322 RepID=A0A9E7G280_9LILI|nr:resistance protein [Musa troglodytarum]
METALTAAAVRFAVDKLVTLLEEQYKAVSGVQGKLQMLQSLHDQIDTVLEVAESRAVVDHAVNLMLLKLGDMACKIEDVLDLSDTEARRRRSGARRCMTGTFERQAGGEDRRLTHSLNAFSDVGRGREKEDIVNLLIDHESKETISVIAIVGMGGLGKTTLAQLVSNDERVKSHFSLTMWKDVGRDFNPTKLMESVLEQATENPINISETELVQRELRKALAGKRFLLVLDDVWNEDQLKWEELKAVLQENGAKGSKIVVTTRSLKVSSIMGSSTPHRLQPLSDDACWSLFRRFAFKGGEERHSLVEIGKEIVKKCGGVPLAAISLGGLLRFKRDEDAWVSVLNSEIWQLEDDEDRIMAALRLSYHDLNRRSKQCFAFCSLFPKNSQMETENLVQLWVANGIIRPKVPGRGSDDESIGNDVFRDLLLRSFFQEGKTDVDGHVTSCKMHDLMHDLARSVAGDECCNLGHDQVHHIQNRTRHLFVDQFASSSVSEALCKPESLRTLLSLQNHLTDAVVLRCVFSKLKLLRALDLAASDIKKVPESVGKLIHLRYLNLSKTSIAELPSSITLLQNLQYLILSRSKVRELPKNLSSLQSLRHLDISGCPFLTHMPRRFSRLTSLQRLSNYIVGKRDGCSIRELKDLDLHGDINIEFYVNVSNDSCAGEKILKNKQHLKSLRLHWVDASSDHSVENLLDDLCPHARLKRLSVSNYGGVKLPTWLADSQIPNLVEVKLINCRNCERIPQFGNLRFLTELQVNGMESVSRIQADFYGNGEVQGFPSLRQFSLYNMPNLEEWSGPEGLELFPRLHTLTIGECPRLMALPRLPRIERLEMQKCNGSLLSSLGTLTSLSSLLVDRILGITSLPVGLFQNLASLARLNIADCTELESLPVDEMQHLTALQHLTISGCKALRSFPLNVERLIALQSLNLRYCINLGSLPEGLHSLTSLRSLRVVGCRSVTTQPEAIIRSLNSVREQFETEICCRKMDLSGRLQDLGTLRMLRIFGGHSMRPVSATVLAATTLSICCCEELSSLAARPPSGVLEDVTIEDCSNLTALPDWLAELRSLRYLSIRNCPELASLPRALLDLGPRQGLWIEGCPQLHI